MPLDWTFPGGAFGLSGGFFVERLIVAAGIDGRVR